MSSWGLGSGSADAPPAAGAPAIDDDKSISKNRVGPLSAVKVRNSNQSARTAKARRMQWCAPIIGKSSGAIGATERAPSDLMTALLSGAAACSPSSLHGRPPAIGPHAAARSSPANVRFPPKSRHSSHPVISRPRPVWGRRSMSRMTEIGRNAATIIGLRCPNHAVKPRVQIGGLELSGNQRADQGEQRALRDIRIANSVVQFQIAGFPPAHPISRSSWLASLNRVASSA